MTLSAKKVFLREVLILIGMVSFLVVSQKIGQFSLISPIHQYARTHNNIPKYKAADSDKSTILFENGEVFLFRKPPTNDEVAKAYRSQDSFRTGATYKVLYPTNTYINFWIFHLNAVYGFLQIEFDVFGAWFFMLAYPIYWMARCMRRFHKEVTAGI